MSHSILYEISNDSTHHSHGAITIDGTDYFFKRLGEAARLREKKGYKHVAPYYPTARYENTYYDGDDELVLYEFLSDVRAPGGMLSDILDESYKGDTSYDPLIDMFRDTYKRTLRPARCTAQNIFFADRIKSRVKHFYTSAFIDEWTDRVVRINSQDIMINLRAMLESLEDFFAIPKQEMSVVSQGDPTEYNIGTRPVLLDYDAGGRVPLAAEAATMTATTLHFGDYMARKYNPGYYERRGLTKINEPRGTIKNINRVTTTRRRQYTQRFAQMIDSLVPEGISTHEANAYACYFAMKLVAVFNLSQLPKHEVAYILAVTQHVFNQSGKCQSFSDLEKVSAL